MLFNRVAAFAVAALPFLAIATPVDVEVRTDSGSTKGKCATGPVQWCKSVESAKDSSAQSAAGLLGIVLPLTGNVGLGCNPINVIGVGEGTCSANAVCCEDNSHGSMLSVGCIPVQL
ncbi:hydrophobin family protein [Escherichia coli]